MNAKEEEKNRGFVCINCGKWVPISPFTKTLNRNHCPHCLWSKHVDSAIAGDRMSVCNTGMKPIGLNFKNSRTDKWGGEVQNELMLIHQCIRCQKISINRVLAEDNSSEIIRAYEEGLKLDGEMKKKLGINNINVLSEENREEVETQIFGN
ncbi:RNHCP domain-containing protein [Patescibacteria group bacterium]|nr:RNHCP domain-containing protein [Patescibacteria group bacterium]